MNRQELDPALAAANVALAGRHRREASSFSSIEAFAQNGTVAMTHLIFPLSSSNRLKLFSASGKPVAITGDLWKLRTIWK